MKYHVDHHTAYRYSQPVSRSVHLAHLRPRSLPRQKVLNFALRLRPTPSEREERDDYFGNPLESFTIEVPHEELRIESVSDVEVLTTEPPPHDTTAWEQVGENILQDHSPAGLQAREFLGETPQTPRLPELATYACESFSSGRPFVDAAHDLMTRIHRDYEFDPTATTVTTPLEQLIKQKRGVCQDFAHLMIACLRSLRLPARYMSGYLRTTPPPGQPQLEGTNASHAWVAMFSPDSGWFDLDPTNNRFADQDYITLGWGREYSDVSPIRGVITGGGEHELRLSVDVVPIDGSAQ